MRRNFFLAVCLLICNLGLFAQNELYNDGSLIHVQNGGFVYVQGEVNNASGSMENEGEIELLGDWTNTADYLSNTSGQVTFSGLNLASISGNMVGLNDFFNLRINKLGANAAVKRVILNNDIEVDNLLTFTSGRISTDANEVNITNTSLSAIIGHTQAGSAIDDRYVEGNLRRAVGATGAYYDFPVGESPAGLGYQLLRLRLQTLSTTNSLIAHFQSATPAPSNLVECGPWYNCVLGSHGQWILNPDQGSPTYDLLAVPRNFGANCGAGTYTLQLGSQLLGDPCIVYNGIPTLLTGSEIPRTGLSTFAPIAVTGSGGVLPVKLLSFTGQKDAQTVVLDWITDHELNNDFFEIERSADGLEFSAIGQVKGQGTTDQMTEYKMTDYNPLSGTSYYRLKQVDFDGKYSLSNIVEINFGSAESLVQISPNPFNDYFEIYWRDYQNATFELFTVHGQLVKEYSLENISTEIDGSNLASGIYYYRVTQNSQLVIEGKIMRK